MFFCNFVMFFIYIYLYTRWYLIQLLATFFCLFCLKMIILGKIIRYLDKVISKSQVNFFTMDLVYNYRLTVALYFFKDYNAEDKFKSKFLKIFFDTIIYVIVILIIPVYIMALYSLKMVLSAISMYYYFVTSIAENIFHYSEKYTSQFKKQKTWFSWFIYIGIKSYFRLRLAFMVFDLFFKGTLFWLYKKIEPKLLALFSYYYKRSISEHLSHFKVL